MLTLMEMLDAGCWIRYPHNVEAGGLGLRMDATLL